MYIAKKAHSSEIDNNLVSLRKQSSITQEELAAKLDVTRQTIISIEKGHYTPSLPLALKIADLFNKKVEDIFYYEKTN